MAHRSVWDRFWARRERRLWKATAQPGISGAIDLPRPVQQFVHGFQLKGWVSSENRAVVAAYLDGQKVWEGMPDAPRPDVGEHAREFSTFVPAGRLVAGRWATLKVTARRMDTAEHAAVTLNSFPVVRGTGGRKLQRWAYGGVWDREALNLSDAMDAVAGYTDKGEWERSGRSTAEHLTRTLSITRDDDVLEVGCGAARVGVHLAPKTRRWMGADVSKNMLRFAESALAGTQNTSLHHLNGFDLAGVPDESVDVAYCTAVFMHLDEWDRFRYVQEFHRVLRPGGRVYFDNFDLRSPDGWALFVEMSSLDIAVRPPNVSKASTQQELEWYAAQAGFEHVTSETGRLWITITARKR